MMSSDTIDSKRTGLITCQLAKADNSETIVLIETPPQPDWFMQVTMPDGQVRWYLRIGITGLRVRRYGPFPSQENALLFLDRFIDCIGDGVNESMEYIQRYQVEQGPFEYRGGHYPIIETESIISAEHGKTEIVS
jgi:hypothetical protein